MILEGDGIALSTPKPHSVPHWKLGDEIVLNVHWKLPYQDGPTRIGGVGSVWEKASFVSEPQIRKLARQH